MRRQLLFAAVTAALAGPVWAAGATASDIEQRLQTLEQRVDSLETAPSAGPPSSAGSFNPAVALILSGVYTNLSRDPARYRITGFPVTPAADIGPGRRGFSLSESELDIYANIDPYFYGGLSYAIQQDNTASVEEAFIQTIALNDGFTVKAGRFFSSIGYLNSQHNHVWDFVDAPLIYQAFLGTQFGDDAVQLKWLAPTDTFFEVGTELGRGMPFPGSDNGKNGVGASTVFAHLGGDVGVSSSWRAGLSVLNTSPRDRMFVATDLGGNDVNNAFTGQSRTWIADAVWKYAPNGNPVYTNFKLQGEYMSRRENGSVTYDAASAAASTAGYDAKQSGWYLQGVYQFMPYWRVGLRTERLDHGAVDYAANDAFLPRYGFDPSRNSVMVDYSPSEFSRIRVQLAADKSRQGNTDDQLFVQYLMSIGAHGAHQY